MAQLPKEVAKHFDCDYVTRIITRAPDRTEVDLSKISLKQARELHKKGFLPMLKPKAKAAPRTED